MRLRIGAALASLAACVALTATSDAQQAAQQAPRAPAAAAAGADSVMRVDYHGELFDDSSRPISGVFPLTFAILGPNGQPIWSEEQFVAVFQGEFDVQLGRIDGVPRAYAGSEHRLRVSLGDSTVAEHRYRMREWHPEDDSASLPVIERLPPVDLSGRAVRADRATLAHDCAALGGRSVEQLDHAVDLRTRLDELRTRINRPPGNRIGTETVVLPRIGNDSGNPYDRSCPPGFVVTGIRGGEGNLLDSYRPICTQLQ